MKRFLVICIAALFAFSACGRRVDTPEERAERFAKEVFDAIETVANEGEDNPQVGNLAAEISDYIFPLTAEQELEFGKAFASMFYECNDRAGYGKVHTRERLLTFITTYLGVKEDPDRAFGQGIATIMFDRNKAEHSEDPAGQGRLFARELVEILKIGEVFDSESLLYDRGRSHGIRLNEYCESLTDKQAEAFLTAYIIKFSEYCEEYGYGKEVAEEYFQSILDKLQNYEDEIVVDSVSVAN